MNKENIERILDYSGPFSENAKECLEKKSVYEPFIYQDLDPLKVGDLANDFNPIPTGFEDYDKYKYDYKRNNYSSTFDDEDDE